MRYAASAPAAAGGQDEIALLKLRYKRPGEERSQLIEAPVRKDGLRAVASDSMRLAAAVAAFADALRGGKQIDGWGWERIAATARSVRLDDRWGLRAEFIGLVERARVQLAAAAADAAAAEATEVAVSR